MIVFKLLERAFEKETMIKKKRIIEIVINCNFLNLKNKKSNQLLNYEFFLLKTEKKLN